MRLESNYLRALAARTSVIRERANVDRCVQRPSMRHYPLRMPAARTREARRPASTKGQMTIEFAVMFPVMLMIALVAFNSVMFLSQCASFDRIFREAVCVYAPSPASDQGSGQICAQITGDLDTFQEKDYLDCTVSSSVGSEGLSTYRGSLFYTPTLFGAHPLRQVFGISLPPIEHTVEMTVDSYKPGVFL